MADLPIAVGLGACAHSGVTKPLPESANRFRKAREDAGLTQAGASRGAEVDVATISRAERGQRINLTSVQKLATLYGVTVDHLLAIDHAPVTSRHQNPETAHAVQLWLESDAGDDLTEADREWAHGLLFRDLSAATGFSEITPRLIGRLWREWKQLQETQPVRPNIRPGRKKLDE